tara:strand:- start:82 stop:315 length:234 start_codon:yes stop_codon:yes gene_type:complete
MSKKNISDVLSDCHQLVAELRQKLKTKCQDVLNLRKEVDRITEELQLCELRYNHLKNKIDEYTQDPLNKGRIDDSSR